MFLTANTLRRAGSCEAYVTKFRELFPEGVEVTPELCVKHLNDFDWHWAADNLMSREERTTWENDVTAATAEHQRVNAEWERKLSDAYAEHHRLDREVDGRFAPEISRITRERDAILRAVRVSFERLLEPINQQIRAAYQENRRVHQTVLDEMRAATTSLAEEVNRTRARLVGEILAARTAPPTLSAVTPEDGRREAQRYREAQENDKCDCDACVSQRDEDA